MGPPIIIKCHVGCEKYHQQRRREESQRHPLALECSRKAFDGVRITAPFAQSSRKDKFSFVPARRSFAAVYLRMTFPRVFS